nr:zf-CCHC domain-containing protein/UBN2 domain-containing protein [Tanacetum cinerariifolium]
MADPFNTIITSFKALDEGFSSKNYVRKFLRALHPKCRAKVTAIEESKDLSSLALDELIDNLKVHEVVMEKDFKIYRRKNDDEEYAMAVRNFKKFSRRKGKFVWQPREEKKLPRQRDEKKGKSDRKCFRCGDPNHLIGDCPKPSRNKDKKAFIGGSWRYSENDVKDKTNDETCLMAQSSNEKFGLEDSKPTKTPISMDIKLTKEDEAYSVYSSKYRGAIDLSNNLIQHSRTKRIEIRHLFLRDNVQKGNISIEKVASEDNIADIFTKPLKPEVFNYLRLGLGIMELVMDSDSPSSQN